MEDSRCFVQFIHPGGEHDPDKGNLKCWNRDSHRRKFLKSHGRYLDHGEVLEGQIELWGEWEPESTVTKRLGNPVADGPNYIYEPFFVRHRDGVRQNTDPFVFGERFHYTGCRQHRNGHATQLRNLAPGSLVLFGSCLQKSRFVIDTVFVVSGQHIDHTSRDYRQTLQPAVSDTYWTVTVEPWYAGERPPTESYRLYFGATVRRPIHGMYSFFPCQPYKADGGGFARPEIGIPGFITPHLTQGAKIARDLDMNKLRELWETVAGQVQRQGLMLGVFADLPPQSQRQVAGETLTGPASCAVRRRAAIPLTKKGLC